LRQLKIRFFSPNIFYFIEHKLSYLFINVSKCVYAGFTRTRINAGEALRGLSGLRPAPRLYRSRNTYPYCFTARLVPHSINAGKPCGAFRGFAPHPGYTAHGTRIRTVSLPGFALLQLTPGSPAGPFGASPRTPVIPLTEHVSVPFHCPACPSFN
jgi:hypothetical protein